MGDENEVDSSVMRIGKRCYVGNLAWKTSWQDLKDKFRDVGNVVYANVMRDDGGKPSRCTASYGASAICFCVQQTTHQLACPATGRSKGWGIVEFETPEEVGFSLPTRCTRYFPSAAIVLHTAVQVVQLHVSFAGSHCCEHVQWYRPCWAQNHGQRGQGGP